MNASNRITRRVATASILLSLLVGATIGRAQQAPNPGDIAPITSTGAGSDEGSRSYVPSLFGAWPIAVDMWQPTVASNEPAPPAGIIDSSEQNSGTLEPWAPYVRNPALQYMLYGLNVSGTYQHLNAANGVPADTTAFPMLNPYLGLMGRTRTGYYVLQYSPSIVPYDADTGSSFTYHNMSLNATGDFTRRLKWNFNLGAGYGAELSRLTGNLNAQTVVSGVPIADAGYASVQPLNGNTLNTIANFGIGYQLSARQTIGVNVSDAYYGFISNASSVIPNFHSDTASIGLTFDEKLNEWATLRAYASRSRVFSSVLPCSSVSGGVGLLLRPTRTVSLDFGAGPSSGCQAESANFHGTVSASPRESIRVYLSSAREMDTAFRINTRWEDNVVAGITKQFRRAELGFDGGYFRGQSLGLIGSTNGYFFSPRVDYRLSRLTSVGFSYRKFHGSTLGGGPPDISFAMATFKFSPHTVPLQK